MKYFYPKQQSRLDVLNTLKMGGKYERDDQLLFVEVFAVYAYTDAYVIWKAMLDYKHTACWMP